MEEQTKSTLRQVNYSNNLQIARNILEKKREKQSFSGHDEFELIAEKSNFAFYQRRMNYVDGDKILKQFIVDEAWSMYDCMRFFNIGADRFKRIKTARIKKKSFLRNKYHSGGQLSSIDSKSRDATFSLFIRYAHRCFADNNEPLMKSSCGKVIIDKPKVHEWKSVSDVRFDYKKFNHYYFDL